MLSNIKLSIVIPVYGVEGYIINFTNSLFPQMHEDIQLIFINDGCKDQSIDYLEQEVIQLPLALRANIQIIHQDNQGVSAARNTGLKLVEGDYTTFLDPDDTVVECYIKDILNAIDEHTFDIMHFNFIEEAQDQYRKLIHYVDKTQLLISSKNTLNSIFSKNHWFPWARVIKSELIKDFKFPVGFIYEDLLSLPFIYQENLRIYEYNKALVNYQYRPGSITNSGINEKTLISFEYGVELYRDKHEIEHYRYVYLYLLDLLFYNYLSLNLKEYLSFIYKYKNRDIIIMKKYIQEFHWKKRLMIQYPRTFYFYRNRSKLFKGST